MARIPEEEIERIKREVSVRALVEEAGVALARHGSNGDLAGLCPFHSEETGSLVVTESRGLWHCFGCGKGGDAIAWVMEREGVSFREACERLMARLGQGGALPGQDLAARVGMGADGSTLLRVAIEIYNARARLRPEGARYLRERGIEHASELIERYTLGVSDRSLCYGLPDEFRGPLQEVGLIRPSGHELFAGSLVVPIFEGERVVEVYGRKMGERLRKGTPLHLYLPGPHRGVWNGERIACSREVLLCEGFFDSLTLVDRGLENTTFVYGVEGLTGDHVELFKQGGVERVVFLYDGDGAGDRGSEKHGERLIGELGVECFRARLPRGHDVNSYARATKDARDALADLVRGAEWMGKGLKPVVAIGAVEASEPVARQAPPSLAAELEPPPPAPASPVAPEPELEVPTAIDGDAITIRLGDREYRARGLEKNAPGVTMKVTLRATRRAELYVDTLDLNVAKARKDYAKEAADELGVTFDVVKHDLGRVWYRLEQIQDERARGQIEARQAVPTMTDQEREEAMALWRDPDPLGRALADLERCGVVGERTNKLVGLLAAISRKLAKPLGVIIQSSSAAGKTALMEAVLAFVPEEERVKYSAVTGQSLFYMSDQDLRHKVLALVEEEGAERAAYALKLLKSEGELAIASTGKDPQTGRLVTHEYRVEGPVALLLTTTAIEVDEELQNRCIVLTVDEDREQTRAIHRQQREWWTLEGLAARRERDRIVKLHQNAQRLLRPVDVINPWGRRLTFLDDKLRTRRDHDKYLVLIAVIAFVHQYQREIKTMIDHGQEVRYVEVTLDDIELANRLAHEVLGRSLDELAPQTRRLLEMIEEMVRGGCEEQAVRREEYRFSRRAIREYTGWSDFQVRVHLDKLVDLEYVLVHRGGRGQSFVYELLYDGGGKDGRPHLTGLLDVEALREELRRDYDANLAVKTEGVVVETGGVEGGSSPHRAPIEPRVCEVEIGKSGNGDGQIEDKTSEGARNAHTGREASSYQTARRSRKRAAGSEGA